MIRNRIFLKSLAVFFILEIFSGVILPSMSFALTSGPTSPEHTSFEPVDVTDMVNISTGDMVYNLPLFEVPGPAGGFPISMAYHAGIQPEVDASWVGLGWTLNTGAINRTVDGAPDDFANAPSSERTFWEGGTKLGLSTGVSFGNGVVTAGLSFASDTYQGMSVGANVSVGTGAGGASLGVEHTVDSYGRAAVKQSAVVQSIYQARFDQLKGAYDQVSGISSINSAVKSASSLLPVSYSSQTGKTGNIRSIGFNFNANIPIQQGIALRLAGLFKRYWSNEKVNSFTFGSLYFPLEKTSAASIGSNTYDINDLYYLDKEQIGGNVTSYRTVLSKNPSLGFAGTFPTYDSYVVTGQGIGGIIRPYHLKANLYRSTQRSASDSIIVQPYPLGGNIKPTFRFVNDFSNSFLYGQDEFVAAINNEEEPLSFQFKQAKETTGDGTGVPGYVNGALAGSRGIRYFTKYEVSQGYTPGFVRSTALGQEAQPWEVQAPQSSVGAFMVTNESGVSYHYGLPVISYDEYSFSGGTDYKNKWSVNLFKRVTPYAYTWLLTAMTGPDYVDTNADGVANEGDTGYWITFEYGKWSRNYSWRNPSENFNKDLDRTFDFFSKGKKEIYYLNAIRSATHTALFVKELRRDGKGVVHDFEEAAKIDGLEVEDIDKGGYDPVDYGSTGIRHPGSTLRLKEILLLKNTDMPYSLYSMARLGTTYNHAVGANVHYGVNILDVHDIADIRNDLLQRSVRSVEFDHDYSLAPQTPNSFISAMDTINDAAAHLANTASGKLTLNGVKMKGKGGIGSLPDIKFGYDLKEGKLPANGKVTFVGSIPDGVNARVYRVLFDDQIPGDLQPGDMVKLYRNGNETRYGVVLSLAGLEVTFQVAGSDLIFNNSIINAIEKTKNPPYVAGFRDIWGFYKPDYVDYKHENVSRMVTEVSARTTDAWSLRTIKTVTGAEIDIDYESDTYDNSIKQISTLPIKSVEIHNSSLGRVKVSLHGAYAGYYFKAGDQLKINGILRRALADAGGNVCNCDDNGIYFWTRFSTFEFASVVDVGPDYIIVGDDGLLDWMEVPQATIWVDCSTLRETTVGTGRRYEAHYPWEFTGGDLQFETNALNNNPGGGIRVRSISVTNEILQTVNTISYDYKQGVTPYEPVGLDGSVPRMEDLPDCLRAKETEALNDYQENFILKVAYRNMADLFANARMMPGPGVMYGQVNVRESTTQADGTVYPHQSYKTYRFEVFNPKLIDIFNRDHNNSTPVLDAGYGIYTSQPVGTPHGPPPVPVQGLPVDGMTTNNVSVQDFSAVIGTLKSITTLDLEDRKLSETSYQYLFDELTTFSFPGYRAKLQGFKNQGLIEEVFADARLVRNKDNPRYWLIGVLSKYSQFPGVLVSTTSTNFKTGIAQTTRNVEYDFYSGQVVKSLTNDAFGNQFLTEAIPAYRKYSALEPTVSGGRNMLVQSAGDKTYKAHVSSGEIIHDGLLAASVQTWSDTIRVINNGTGSIGSQPGIWRPHSSYSFAGADNVTLHDDGSHRLENFSDFTNWNNTATIPENWQLNSTSRLYDRNSHALEARDINGNFSSTKMSSDGTKVFSTVANARHSQAAYSGAEDDAIGGFYDGGKIAKLDGQEVLSAPDSDPGDFHTGRKKLSLTTTNTKTFRFQLSSTGTRTYHASVWVNAPGGRLCFKRAGVTDPSPAVPSAGKKAGPWYLLELTIPAGSGNLEVWCETAGGVCDFDDFRVHPIDAAMVSYVYNKWGEVSHIIDNNNLYTEYHYDAAGRVIQTAKESFNHGVVKTTEFQYHYKNLQN